MGSPPSEHRPRSPRAVVLLVSVMAVLTISAFLLVAVLVTMRLGARESSTVRSTASVVTAVRDLARLETTELHIEKIIDLSDKQSRFFGLVTATDAILLVASGEIVIGIDLAKLQDDDVALDPQSGGARVTLPEPEILSIRLDEANTYVYRRTTELLADRNEQLESRARKEAVAFLEAAAHKTDAFERSKKVAERQVRSLLQRLGPQTVDVRWRARS